MKVETESGVSITIIAEGSSKVLIFDKSVRTIELSKDETVRISALLSPNLNASPKANINLSKTKNKESPLSEGF